MRLQRSRWVVQQYTRCPEVRQLARLLHQRIRLAGAPRAIDEARLELAACRRDCVRGLTEVRYVVERIVQPEDVDAVRRGGCNEAADEVVVDGARTDEQTPAQSQPERGLQVRLQRTNAFPRALDSTPYCTVEAAAAGDFQVREARAVEDLRDAQLLRGWDAACERLLSEQAHSRVGERRHDREPNAGDVERR